MDDHDTEETLLERPAWWTETRGLPSAPGSYREAAPFTAPALVLRYRWMERPRQPTWFCLVGFFGLLPLGLASALPTSVALVVARVVRGMALAYCLAGLAVNRTTVRAGPKEIVVRKGPLPWPGARRALAAPKAHLPLMWGWGEGREAAGIYAAHGDETKTLLIEGLADPDEALWLMRRLAAHYGVVHKARRQPG